MEKTVLGVWQLNETAELEKLVIEKDGSIAAPEGKYVVMTVDGVSVTPSEGIYRGRIVLSVKDEVAHTFVRLDEKFPCRFQTAVYIKNGKYMENASIRAAVQKGEINGEKAEGVHIKSKRPDYSGFIIEGGRYEINGIKAELEGYGEDSEGNGAAILVLGDAKVAINNADIRAKGPMRAALCAFDNADVELNDCFLSVDGPDLAPADLELMKKLDRHWMPPWQIGLRGTARTTSIDDSVTVRYNNCRLVARNWGVLSVDDASPRSRMFARNSVFEVTGDNGYGCFSINCDAPDNYQLSEKFGSFNTFYNCRFFVPTYLMYLSVAKSGAEFTDKTIVYSKRYGVYIFRNSGGLLKINGGTEFYTGQAAIVVKGSSSKIEVDNAKFNSADGAILQLMDCDDPGHLFNEFRIPAGEIDEKDPARDLTAADPLEDVFMTVSNTEISGNFFNATTNLLFKRQPNPEDCPEVPPNFKKVRGIRGNDLQGAKNLDLKLTNVKLTGIISSALGRYKEGLTVINESNCEEMSNITCTPAEPVNNGIILTMDGKSVWNVTETSYITKLVLEEGAVINGAKLYVDGAETKLVPGTYTGTIKLKVK
ncbi:MAG: hypothetical protein LBL57_04485 [Tannerella sp.]|jgi:hypothetical protein|nr:hypothetical protein [Tannerella sp.]